MNCNPTNSQLRRPGMHGQPALLHRRYLAEHQGMVHFRQHVCYRVQSRTTVLATHKMAGVGHQRLVQICDPPDETLAAFSYLQQSRKVREVAVGFGIEPPQSLGLGLFATAEEQSLLKVCSICMYTT